ncbi:hypothetical protein Mal64_33680 [Pseudobythopirellula maris]|uniref:DUF1559 domain-containing protein n=1 Tax=Pseudobythopirellula maris TaxID=2527991 RepID=A0A5C5ZGS6_9BACT|nr:DUF1559 domain-containing protein [Pseudobythopirellula maris]TWT86542.1 hypothetical protein Mal64_33680 [Pseudobythopirellula maris]
MNRSASARRVRTRAFTLAELLTVVAIIAVLIALLLPAVQAAREAARRSHCQNNLKQQILAAHEHESAFGHLPAGARLHEKQKQDGLAWRVSLLPFVEEQALYDEIEPLENGGFRQKMTALTAPRGFLCPSWPKPPEDAQGPWSSYYGVAGAGATEEGNWSLEQFINGDVAIDGVLHAEGPTRLAEVTDGASHTLAIGEQYYLASLRRFSVGAIWLGAIDEEVATYAVRNIRWPINADHENFGYCRCDWEAPAGADRSILANDLFFGSAHPGGAHFALADGSVRFLSDGVEFDLYKAMATRNGGEALDR